MEIAGYGTTDMALNRASGNGDETLLVKFENISKLNPAKSEEAGLEIHEMVTFINIRTPGQRTEEIMRRLRPQDKLRFPEHWKAFNDRENLPQAEGTPLSEWAGVNAAQVEEFKYLHITTVQQLVNVSDSNANNIKGFYALKEKALAYLNSAIDNKAAEELEKQKQENIDLLKRISALEALSNNTEKPTKRGRPKKSDKEILETTQSEG